MEKHDIEKNTPETAADINLIIKTVRLCGMLTLENGGETSRAEETVMRICSAYGYNESEVMAYPTGLIISLICDGQTFETAVQRVKKRTIDLTKLNEVNDISRALADRRITLSDAIQKLERLNTSKPINKPFFALIAGISTACFAVLYGGSLFDALVAFLCGGVVQYISSMFKRTDLYKFAISLIGGIIIALFAVTFTTLFGTGSVDKIIVGAIIPLLPGLAMNSAIRDTMNGDLVSGSARLAEVMLVALSLAAGAGIVFAVFVGMGGTIRQM